MRPRVRHRQLFRGKRNAQDVGGRIACEIERQPTPARSDVKHLETRSVEVQFRGDVAFLRHLGRFERHRRMREISAGILPVGIEEQIEQRARKIVVMRDILPGPPHRIELRERSCPPAQTRAGLCYPTLRSGGHIREREFQNICNRSFLHRHATIHVGLAECQIGLSAMASSVLRPCTLIVALGRPLP